MDNNNNSTDLILDKLYQLKNINQYCLKKSNHNYFGHCSILHTPSFPLPNNIVISIPLQTTFIHNNNNYQKNYNEYQLTENDNNNQNKRKCIDLIVENTSDSENDKYQDCKLPSTPDSILNSDDVPNVFEIGVNSNNIKKTIMYEIKNKKGAKPKQKKVTNQIVPRSANVCVCGSTVPGKGPTCKWRKGPNGEVLCNSCGLQNMKRPKCLLCDKIYNAKEAMSEQESWVRCDDCKHWVMSSCGGIKDVSIYDDKLNSKPSHYTCPNCNNNSSKLRPKSYYYKSLVKNHSSPDKSTTTSITQTPVQSLVPSSSAPSTPSISSTPLSTPIPSPQSTPISSILKNNPFSHNNNTNNNNNNNNHILSCQVPKSPNHNNIISTSLLTSSLLKISEVIQHSHTKQQPTMMKQYQVNPSSSYNNQILDCYFKEINSELERAIHQTKFENHYNNNNSNHHQYHSNSLY